MATPLLIDIDGDSLRDIVAPSQSGEVYAIHGENGHIVDNWPFFLEDRSFYASPLAVSASNCCMYCNQWVWFALIWILECHLLYIIIIINTVDFLLVINTMYNYAHI